MISRPFENQHTDCSTPEEGHDEDNSCGIPQSCQRTTPLSSISTPQLPVRTKHQRSAFPTNHLVLCNIQSNINDWLDSTKYMVDLKILELVQCDGVTITRAMLARLKSLHTLIVKECAHTTIMDDAFVSLPRLHTLRLEKCADLVVSNRAFASMLCLQELSFSACEMANPIDETTIRLPKLTMLDASECSRFDDDAC